MQNLLANATIDQLRDEQFLIDAIRQWGIINDPAIDFGKVNEPFRTANGMFQQPEQLAPALIFLSHKKITSYIEVGTFTGATFAFVCSYLSRFNPYLTGTAIDKDHYFDPEMREIAERVCLFQFIKGTSSDIADAECDLCLLDADHKLASIKKDYIEVGKHAKICMIHDINDEGTVKERDGSGTVEFWKSIKKPKDKEFVNHPEGKNIMGIGITL